MSGESVRTGEGESENVGKKRANGEDSIRKRKNGRWEGFYTAVYDPETGKQKLKNVLGKTQAGGQRKAEKSHHGQSAAGYKPQRRPHSEKLGENVA